MKQNLLFLTLKVFSATGGIEKVSRLAGKAFFELGADSSSSISIYSAYDGTADLDEKYFPAAAFKGFGGNRTSFVLESIRRGGRASVVVLSHINLISVGYAIKQLHPKTKLVLLAHGIEVWHPLPGWKRKMLRACDLILPVSRFTKDKMVTLHGLPLERLRVVNNCLDPYLPSVLGDGKSSALLKRYGLTKDDKILLTLTRLSFKERYKGYDEVLMAVKALKKTEPRLKYLIVGKYDDEEKARLHRLIDQQGLKAEVILAGFVPDEELAVHFGLADAYVMPSRKEGFGIVFIEALYYGKPVIAGNIDGSVDALASGEFGLLVNPDRPGEIREAIRKILSDRKRYLPNGEEVRRRFGFAVYKEGLREAIEPFFNLAGRKSVTLLKPEPKAILNPKP